MTFRAGDLISWSMEIDGPWIRVTAQHGGKEGHGTAPCTGVLGADVALYRAVRDLNDQLDPAPLIMGTCPNGGDHTPGISDEWVGRCTKCGTPC